MESSLFNCRSFNELIMVEFFLINSFFDLIKILYHQRQLLNVKIEDFP